MRYISLYRSQRVSLFVVFRSFISSMISSSGPPVLFLFRLSIASLSSSIESLYVVFAGSAVRCACFGLVQICLLLSIAPHLLGVISIICLES